MANGEYSRVRLEAEANEIIRLVKTGKLNPEDVPRLEDYGVNPESIKMCSPFLKMYKAIN